MIKCYLNILQKQIDGFDRALLSQTLYLLILGATTQGDVRGGPIFSALENYFANVKYVSFVITFKLLFMKDSLLLPVARELSFKIK